VARPSRPPGFDMTYRPAETVFGPPWKVWLPSIVYVLVAIGVLVFVIAGEMAGSNTWIHIYVVEKDIHRIIGSQTLAGVLVVSSLAALVRSSMRGVRLRPDGLVYRDVLAFGWPRVKRYRWAQIDRIILDQTQIALELWDGSFVQLPRVGDRDGLCAALEKVGAARAIPVRGGAGLDEIPESAEFDEA
jgi:hypothetical protein